VYWLVEQATTVIWTFNGTGWYVARGVRIIWGAIGHGDWLAFRNCVPRFRGQSPPGARLSPPSINEWHDYGLYDSISQRHFNPSPNKLSCARVSNKGSSCLLYPVAVVKPVSISLSDCAPYPEAETESGIRLVDSSHDKYYRIQRLAFYLSSLFQGCPIRSNLEF
jgi:hypothetical protein